MNTLKTIAAASQVEYRTVQRWYAKAKAANNGQDLGTLKGKSRYFTDAEVTLITGDYVKPEATQTEAIKLYDAEVVIDEVPQLPQSVNLAHFRGYSPSAIDLSTVQSALALTKQIGAAIEADISSQWEQLEEVKTAKKQLIEATQQLNQQAANYAVESRLLQRLTKAEKAEVSELLGKVEGYGA